MRDEQQKLLELGSDCHQLRILGFGAHVRQSAA